MKEYLQKAQKFVGIGEFFFLSDETLFTIHEPSQLVTMHKPRDLFVASLYFGNGSQTLQNIYLQ